MENIISNLEVAFMWIGLIVTAATAIVAALEKVAEVTPTTKDDEYISTAKKWLSIAASALDKVSVWTAKKVMEVAVSIVLVIAAIVAAVFFGRKMGAQSVNKKVINNVSEAKKVVDDMAKLSGDDKRQRLRDSIK